ncbi:MAG TPA: hypothetical protein VI011_04865 [Asanoa sp.]
MTERSEVITGLSPPGQVASSPPDRAATPPRPNGHRWREEAA